MKKLRFDGATLNALSGIRADSPTAMEECKRIADCQVVRQPQGEMQPHFPDVAVEVIWGLTAATVYYGEPGDRSLGTVDRIVTNPTRLEKTIELMMKSPAYGGTLAALGGRLKQQMGEEKASVLSTVSRHLAWTRTPTMLANIATSSFDVSKIKKKKLLIGVVLPPEHMKSGQGWLRTVINATIMAAVQGVPDESRKVFYFFDEAASLGSPPPESVSDLLTGYRKYGCRGIWVYQATGQLIEAWPRDQGQKLMANVSAKIFFGTSDIQTANVISSMLGKFTQIVEGGGSGRTGGSNRGQSEGSSGMSTSGGSNAGWSTNDSWQQAPRDLLTADEILRLPPRYAITFLPGMAPVLTYMLRYWEEKWLGKRTGGLLSRFRAACRTLAGSLFLLAAGIVLAALLTQAIADQPLKERSAPSFRD